jgi:hypothetical protein
VLARVGRISEVSGQVKADLRNNYFQYGMAGNFVKPESSLARAIRLPAS